VKLLPTSLYFLLVTTIFSTSNPTSVSSLPAPPMVDIRHLPPIYIIAPELPDCVEDGKFPQLVLLPSFSAATQIVPSCHLFDRHEVAWTLNVFYRRWKKEFGDPEGKVFKMLNEVMITWGLERRTVSRAYSVHGKLLENPSVIGLAISPTVLWAHVGDTGHISETSLVHELVHLALWASEGTPDADHEAGAAFGGWTTEHTSFIWKLNKFLRMFNL
jgi:hypothetical protein